MRPSKCNALGLPTRRFETKSTTFSAGAGAEGDEVEYTQGAELILEILCEP
jgi:hypothetical protein